jgi:hypothetical protein
MVWSLKTAIITKQNVCEIIFEDGVNTITTYSYRVDGETDIRWKSRIQSVSRTELGHLNTNDPAPEDITESVR